MSHSPSIRLAARNRECTVRLPGICNRNPETTVLAHLRFGPKAMGGKPCDLCACFACSACHDVIDGRVPTPAGFDYCQAVAPAMAETLAILASEGLIAVPSERERKPKPLLKILNRRHA